MVLMKRALILITLIALLIGIAFAAQAKEKRTQRIVKLAGEEVVDGDFFAAGDSITISGTVNGDAYVAGGEVLVDGRVNGDLLVVGGKVVVEGVVAQDVRLVGGDILLAGQVGRNITVAGGSVNLSNTADVRGNILTASGALRLSGAVNGNLRTATGNLHITSRGRINGDVLYWSSQNALIDDGAKVSGSITKKIVSDPQLSVASFLKKVQVLFILASAFTSIVLGLILITFTPNLSLRISEQIKKHPLSSLGWGFVFTLFIPVAAIILMATLIGIPFALILLFSYVIVLYLARIFVMLWVGEEFSRVFGAKLGQRSFFIIGIAIYYGLVFVPYVGAFVSLAAVLFGFGALLVTKKQLFSVLRKNKMV